MRPPHSAIVTQKQARKKFPLKKNAAARLHANGIVDLRLNFVVSSELPSRIQLIFSSQSLSAE